LGHKEDRQVRINLWHGHMDLSAGLDGPDSPGSEWLDDLGSAFDEAWETGRFPTSGDHGDRGETGEYGSDVIAELATASVSVYTHQRWQVFVDTCAYSSEEAEELLKEGGLTDPTAWAGDVLDRMASNAGHRWLTERIEAQAEQDADAEYLEASEEIEDTDTEAAEEAPPPCARQSAATQTTGPADPSPARQSGQPPRSEPQDRPGRRR
jgi:hypothetical protein